MNQDVLNKYGIKASKRLDNKLYVAPGDWLLSGYLGFFYTADYLEPILNDINLALTGRFEQIKNPDWSRRDGPLLWGGLIQKNMTFRLLPGGDLTSAIFYPLDDMKAIFESLLQILKTGYAQQNQ